SQRCSPRLELRSESALGWTEPGASSDFCRKIPLAHTEGCERSRARSRPHAGDAIKLGSRWNERSPPGIPRPAAPVQFLVLNNKNVGVANLFNFDQFQRTGNCSSKSAFSTE